MPDLYYDYRDILHAQEKFMGTDDLMVSTYKHGQPDVGNLIYMFDKGSWYEGIAQGGRMPGLVEVIIGTTKDVTTTSRYIDENIILDQEIVKINETLWQRVVSLSRGDVLDERVRNLFIANGYEVKSLRNVTVLILEGHIWDASSLLKKLIDFENNPEFLSTTIRKHVIASEIAYYTNDDWTFDAHTNEQVWTWLEQLKPYMGTLMWDSGTFQDIMEFLLSRFIVDDFMVFASLEELYASFRDIRPARQIFYNSFPLFDREDFPLFSNTYVITDRRYSVETGWVYKLDNNWWVPEWMGAISVQNLGTMPSEIKGIKYCFAYPEPYAPKVYYFADQHISETFNIVEFSGYNTRRQHVMSDVDITLRGFNLMGFPSYFDMYTEQITVWPANDLKWGVVQTPEATLGLHYKFKETGEVFLCTEIYDSSGLPTPKKNQ